MIYSEFVPDRGVYRYYDVANERVGLGDDLATPALEVISGIGAASTSIGRARGGRGQFVGEGKFARGVITPLDRTGLTSRAPLSALGNVPPERTKQEFYFLAATVFACGVVVGIYASKS